MTLIDSCCFKVGDDEEERKISRSMTGRLCSDIAAVVRYIHKQV
jgi:hypothetical protein